MCGRDTAFYTWREIHAFSRPLTLTTPADDPEPRFNRAPTTSAWVLIGDPEDPQHATAHQMRWGLIPGWAKDSKIGYSTFNARAETASTKPVFRDSWKRRRCLIPSSGYYEWQLLANGKTKQPYFIHNADAPILMFAGLWARWHSPTSGDIDSYSILTHEAAGPVRELHDRMPLMLPPDLLGAWLNGSSDDAAAIVHAAPVASLAFHRIGNAVGNVRNEGAGLIEPIEVKP